MVSKLHITLLSIFLCCVFAIGVSGVAIDSNQRIGQEPQCPEMTTTQATTEEDNNEDEISLKQREMRDTTILVQTRRGSGSGTIIDRLDTDVDNLFEYRVLTNAHVTYSRFIEYLRGVDSITGKLKLETVDTGCSVVTFDHKAKDWNNYTAKVVSEDIKYDLTVLSFVSPKKLAVAKIADKKMLEQVRVFDDVFAIGCQLGRSPSPTVGIIAQILIGRHGGKEWIVYGNTAQITPGSSGGGLFKKYGDHYYLVGIPYRIAMAGNGQMIPHMSYAISIGTAREFIDKTLVSSP